jgi:hypothetical protein
MIFPRPLLLALPYGDFRRTGEASVTGDISISMSSLTSSFFLTSCSGFTLKRDLPCSSGFTIALARIAKQIANIRERFPECFRSQPGGRRSHSEKSEALIAFSSYRPDRRSPWFSQRVGRGIIVGAELIAFGKPKKIADHTYTQ